RPCACAAPLPCRRASPCHATRRVIRACCRPETAPGAPRDRGGTPTGPPDREVEPKSLQSAASARGVRAGHLAQALGLARDCVPARLAGSAQHSLSYSRVAPVATSPPLS